MDKITALPYLRSVIENDIRHRDYGRVVQLADLYRTLYTGEGIESIIKDMYKVEVPANQITSILPPVIKSTQYPFNKVFRVKPVERLIDFDTADSENKSEELSQKVATYWGGQSLEDYLQYVLIEYGYIDPNAWMVTEFKPFNSDTEKAKPYPFLVLASEAIDYSIQDGEVEYLIVQQELGELSRFTMYLENDTIVFQQVKEKSQSNTEIKGKYYLTSEFTPLAGEVPAVRVGYIPDLKTRGRTFVGMFDKIVSYLMKLIKADYECDVTMGDLAFPKRYEYVEECKACLKGMTSEGKRCNICDGTGKIGIHTTATDIRTFPMPRDKEEFFDLTKITHTDFPPVDGIKLLLDFIDSKKSQAMSLMFNADMFDKTQVSSTATEHNLMRDNLNDAVYPLALNYQRKWQSIVNHIATFTDLNDQLIINLQLPKDYKFKTVAELMADLQAARNAKASIATLAAIEDNINEMLYADRPDELRKIRVKNQLSPFFGYSEEMVRVIIANKETTQFNIVLYSNMEVIMGQLETEYESPWIYDMNIKKIMELVQEKVNEIIETMAAEKPDPIQLENPFRDETEV